MKKFYTIQHWMLTELGIKGPIREVYALIYSFSSSSSGMFLGSARTMSEWTGYTQRTIQRAVQKLLEMGLIERVQQFSANFSAYRAIVPDLRQNDVEVRQNDVEVRQNDVGLRQFDVGSEWTGYDKKSRGYDKKSYGVRQKVAEVRQNDVGVTTKSHPIRDDRDELKDVDMSVLEIDAAGDYHTHAPDPCLRGRYQNVFLSDHEYLALGNEFGDEVRDDYIERLSGHMASTGKKYQNLEATIRTWIRRDRDKKKLNKDEKQMLFFSQFFNDNDRETNT